MAKHRVPWQHEIERDSQVQFQAFVQSLRWIADKITDYGEDWFIRIVHDRDLIGREFYVQLKGTPEVNQYALSTGDFSYPIDVSLLEQWKRYTLPVILVLWDTTNELGYWVHVQPIILANLATNADWLANNAGQRQIHIPVLQQLVRNEGKQLQLTIEKEYRLLAVNKEQLEEIQNQQQLAQIDSGWAAVEKDLFIAPIPQPIPPRVQQQLELAKYDAYTIANPNNAQSWLEKAKIYYELYDLEKAIAAINKAWQLGLSDTATILVRGSIMTEFASEHEGQPKDYLYDAIELFESLRGKVDDFILDYNIGNAYSALNGYQQALQHFDNALKIHLNAKQAAQVWKNRGTCYFHLGDHDEEIASYKKALELNPSLWEAYSSWGVTELHLGNFMAAVALFGEAIHVNPDLESQGFGQLYSLSYALCKTGDLKAAYRRINQLLLLKPNHENGRVLKTYIISRLWRQDPIYMPTALEFFKRTLFNNPNDIVAQRELYFLDDATMTEKFPFPSVDDESRLAQLLPLQLHQYAIFLEDEERLIDAQKCLEMAVAKSGDHLYVHSLARIKRKRGDYIGSIPLLNKLLEENPDSEHIIQEIADCYYFLQNYLECVRFAARSLLLKGNESIYWGNLFFALIQLGKSEIAKPFIPLLNDLRKGTSIEPNVIQGYINDLVEAIRQEFGESFVATTVPYLN